MQNKFNPIFTEELFENKLCTPVQTWNDKEICFAPDASPRAWKHYKEIYKEKYGNSLGKNYDIENPQFFNYFANNYSIYYINLPFPENNTNRLYALKKESPNIVKENDFIYYKATQRLGGETDFNFSDDKCAFFSKILEENNGGEYLDDLEFCHKMHNTLVNFSLMPSMGNLQEFKGRKFDRFDSLIFALSEFYERDKNKKLNDCESEIPCYLKNFKKLSTVNKEALLEYLKLFEDVSDYCKQVYFIDDNELLNDLINSGKKTNENREESAKTTFENAEDVKQYMNLAKRYWINKSKKFQKIYANLPTNQENNL